MIVLSHIQVVPLLAAHTAGASTHELSLDLGLTRTTVRLLTTGVLLSDSQLLPWHHLQTIAADAVGCYRFDASEPVKIQGYSAHLDRFYSLMPTQGAPTVLVGGFPMHRIKGTDPYADTQQKIKAAGKPRGHVLDVCTGPGYTAIAAARTAASVTTIELDDTMLTIARQNPWSQPLFRNPQITQLVGDALEVVATLDDNSYSTIIHDPPIFSLAGELYSGAFYAELGRVLKPGGRLFHYIGSLESKSGAGTLRGVVRRLQAAGFTRIEKRTAAFGVVAVRG